MFFQALPPHARLWLLALATPPARDQEALLARGLAGALTQWRHKGQAYQGTGVLLEPQLIAVAEPTLAAQPSGCAIDGMLRRVQRLVSDLGLALVDPGTSILVRLQGILVPIAKSDLADRLADGTLDATTPLLDLSLYSLEDLRAGRLESPLASTWVGRKFGIQVTI